MTAKIVIHAGFHKTGTTSVQAMLRENAQHLAPHLRVYLKEDFEDLTNKARAFSIDPREKTLRHVVRAAMAFFETMDRNDPRPILIASEDLSGHMPGRHGLQCYDGAGLVMKCLAETAYAHFGSDVELTFYFSTRDPDTWLRSTWWQNLRSTRLTQDFETYRATFEDARSFDDILNEVKEDVAPAHVTSQSLDMSKDVPLGPLQPVLDLIPLADFDPSCLTVLPPENVQPDVGIDAVFLALNQSGLPDKDIQDAKRTIRKMARRVSP
ncbi:hypothetical protein ACG74X_01355 [Marivita sp. S0852]|uniref:hypothetical protein n=1 Tax=Marivita sp. S0852 TaxID=3373893 RepID=UPI003982BBA7